MNSDRILHPTSSSLCAALIALVILASPLTAHVRLDCPNGGVVMVAGTTYTVVWHVHVAHNTQNWDLWYSTTGPNGPWIPIVMDLPAGNVSTGAVHSYVWTVPQALSAQVRVRVRQDNSGTDYYDISNGDNTIAPPRLAAAPGVISVAAGGNQAFTLDAGVGFAGLDFVLAGSATGQAPGLDLGNGIVVPLVRDAYTTFTLDPVNPFLAGAIGVLDGSGQATVSLTLPPGLPPGLVGTTLHHAFAVFTPTQAVLASNAVTLAFQP